MNTRLLAAVVIVAALPAFSYAGLDMPLAGKARVLSTHSPVEEVEVFRFDATAESTLKIVVVASRRTDLDFDLTLVGPGETPVDLTAGKRFRDTGKRVVVAGLVLDATGPYRLEVAGAGTGNYKLVLRVVPRRRYVETLDVDAAATGMLEFAAPEAARLVCKATAPRGSSATPRFGTFDGTDLETEGRRTTRRHTVTLPSIATGGDLSLPVRNDGDEQGDIVVSVVVRPMRVFDRLNFRSGALGQLEGDETVLGQNVDEDGGLVDIADADSDLDGAGVDVPSGALPIPTRITVTSAEDIPPGDDTQPGGPAVEFGPEGLEFIEEATIVLPLDVSMLPLDTVAADIRVIKVDAEGNKTFIDPDDEDVDLDGGTVTVSTSSFSVYQPNVPKGTPNLRTRGFWTVTMKIELTPNGQESGDSRGRVLTLQAGSTRFPGPQSVTGGATVEFEERRVLLTHDADGNSVVSREVENVADSSLSWNIEPDRRSITISTGGGPSRTLTMGSQGSMLIDGVEDDPGLDEVFATIALQRRRRPPPASALVGRYWVGGTQVQVRNGPPGMLLSRTYGTLILRADKTFTVSREEFFEAFAGSAFTPRRTTPTTSGTWGVDRTPGLFFGTVLLAPAKAGDPALRLLPHRRGNVFVGIEAGESSHPQMLVLVKRSTNLRARSLPQEFAAATIGVLEPSTYTVRTSSGADVLVPDFSAAGGTELLGRPGNGTLTFSDSVDLTLVRDTLVPGGVRSDLSRPQPEPPRALGIARTGRLVVAGPPRVVGAISPDGLLGFALDGLRSGSSSMLLTLFIHPAPVAPDTSAK